MLVVIVIAAVVVVAVVVFLAMGRGGELSAERNDFLPLDLGPVSATDVAMLRPPTGLWGYNMQVTDEAMDQIAESIRERDVRIVALEQLVTDLSRDSGPMRVLSSPYPGARHRRAADDPGVDLGVDPAEAEADPVPTETAGTIPVRLTYEPAEVRLPYEPEPVRFPPDPPGPGADVSGPPPEQSHD